MIRINLLPREEKAHRQAAFSFKIGDLVVPIDNYAMPPVLNLSNTLSDLVKRQSIMPGASASVTTPNNGLPGGTLFKNVAKSR